MKKKEEPPTKRKNSNEDVKSPSSQWAVAEMFDKFQVASNVWTSFLDKTVKYF